MDKELNLLELLKIIKKRALLIILFCIVGLLAFSFLTFYVATPRYKSTTQLLVTHSTRDVSSSYMDINNNLTLINTYKEIIKGPVVLEDVRNTLDLNVPIDFLSNQVEVYSQENSQIFSVVVTNENPEQAALMANTIAETFQENIREIMNISNVTIISRATPSLRPDSPNVTTNLAIGFMFSLTLGIGTAVMLEWFDNTIKSEEVIAKKLGWSTLGEIVEYTEKKADKVVLDQPSEKQQATTSVKTRV